MNDTNSKIYSYLGLAMRAGKLTSGDQGVMDAVRSGGAVLVILAADSSASSAKKYKDKCETYRVPFIEFGTREELGASIGKEERVILAIMDAGFAKLIMKCRGKSSEVE